MVRGVLEWRGTLHRSCNGAGGRPRARPRFSRIRVGHLARHAHQVAAWRVQGVGLPRDQLLFAKQVLYGEGWSVPNLRRRKKVRRFHPSQPAGSVQDRVARNNGRDFVSKCDHLLRFGNQEDRHRDLLRQAVSRRIPVAGALRVAHQHIERPGAVSFEERSRLSATRSRWGVEGSGACSRPLRWWRW